MLYTLYGSYGDWLRLACPLIYATLFMSTQAWAFPCGLIYRVDRCYRCYAVRAHSWANVPNRYSALCWRPVTHTQTWDSHSALYRFGRLSTASPSSLGDRSVSPYHYHITRCLHHLIFYSRVFHILVDFTTYDTVHGEAVKNKKQTICKNTAKIKLTIISYRNTIQNTWIPLEHV